MRDEKKCPEEDSESVSGVGEVQNPEWSQEVWALLAWSVLGRRERGLRVPGQESAQESATPT